MAVPPLVAQLTDELPDTRATALKVGACNCFPWVCADPGDAPGRHNMCECIVTDVQAVAESIMWRQGGCSVAVRLATAGSTLGVKRP
jgi:hypothetical protein